MEAGADRSRTILHADMDAFFVAVELLRRPELRGRPVVVGGTGERGVVAAASYEARRFGVHSALPSAVARRRCPQAVFLPGDHARYEEVSTQIQAVFRRYTPLVEPIALDEAFLDVTGAQRLFGPAEGIARALRQAIAGARLQHRRRRVEAARQARLGGGQARVTGRASRREGASSSWRRGGAAFLHPLPVSALWGVGPATRARLERLGVTTVGELAEVPLASLLAAVGNAHGRHLHALARWHDDREVEPDRALKSIGHEETFPQDRTEREELEGVLVRQADAVAGRLRDRHARPPSRSRCATATSPRSPARSPRTSRCRRSGARKPAALLRSSTSIPASASRSERIGARRRGGQQLSFGTTAGSRDTPAAPWTTSAAATRRPSVWPG